LHRKDWVLNIDAQGREEILFQVGNKVALAEPR